MQTLEVTDEQYAVIQRLRATMSEEVVGKYGFVREQDAVQYLIDTLEAATEDGELGDLEFDIESESSGSTATDDVAAAVEAAIEGESPPEDVETVSYDEEGDTSAGEGDSDAANGDGDDSSPADEEADDADDHSEEAGADEDDAVEADDAGGEEEGTSDAEDADESDESDDDSESGAADDDDMLNKMMSLLETHDDKWEESPSADYRYRVDLPDGGTKDVQTKDDVRALLFKNY